MFVQDLAAILPFRNYKIANTACATSSKRRIIDESLKIRGLYEEKIFIFTFTRAGLSAGAGSNFVWLV